MKRPFTASSNSNGRKLIGFSAGARDSLLSTVFAPEVGGYRLEPTALLGFDAMSHSFPTGLPTDMHTKLSPGFTLVPRGCGQRIQSARGIAENAQPPDSVGRVRRGCGEIGKRARFGTGFPPGLRVRIPSPPPSDISISRFCLWIVYQIRPNKLDLSANSLWVCFR